MRFQGTKSYIATDDLKLAVDAALSLEKPLLVKGEPGTGKTMLALEVAKYNTNRPTCIRMTATVSCDDAYHHHLVPLRPASQP